MSPVAERFLNVAGLRLRALEAGEGPVVLLIHGLGDCAEVWDRNLEPLAAAGYRAVAVDLPGHGLSDKPSDPAVYRPDFVPPLLDGLLDALGAERAALVGSSLGGLVASRYAVARPERVSALALVGAAGLGREVSRFLCLLPLLPLWVSGLMAPPQWLLRAVLRGIVVQQHALSADLLPLYHQYRRLPGAAEAFLRLAKQGLSLRGLRPELVLLDQLRSLSMPISILWGRQDRVIPVRHAELAGDALPQAQVERLEACGHWPHREHPERFNAHLVALLFRASAPSSAR